LHTHHDRALASIAAMNASASELSGNSGVGAKPSSAGAEHGVRVGVAAGCAIELCEREPSAQFEAAGFFACAMAMAVTKASLAGTGLAALKSWICAARRRRLRTVPYLSATAHGKRLIMPSSALVDRRLGFGRFFA
jgi:hypothetical protein